MSLLLSSSSSLLNFGFRCCNFSGGNNNCPNKLHHHYPNRLITASFSSSTTANATTSQHKIHPICLDESSEMISSASAVASAIRKASNSPVEFMQRIESAGKSKGGGLVLPGPDFISLCVQQMDLFRRIVHPDALLSVSLHFLISY